MITKIKDSLKNDKDRIIEILGKIGCTYIKPNSNQIRFGRDDEGSGTGNVIRIDTLGYNSFSHDTQGDIITLISEIKNISIGKAIRYLADELGIDKSYKRVEVKPPFGGFYKNISKIRELEDKPLRTYPKANLDEFGVAACKLFMEDGISGKTQEDFLIGYDIWTDRITIPWLSDDGKLAGVMGRMARDLTGIETNYKYLPVLNFEKGKFLYGFYQNYKNILNTNTIIICESEKSVLKGRDINLNNVVALGGNSIKPRQAKLIKSTFANVILALDEGITLEHCKKEAKKVLIDNPFLKNKVWIVDMNNEYVKEKKISLLDMNIDEIQKILSEYLIEVV
ncbi:putative DNA primase [[Clostridium] sordellii]|uniref:hypothetical protein n=1 Tax=Paraclostridium sordellii TaxID=1505 RepID=UPI0005E08469|nr:hypothetical protein [Paeniclostridium sordellii]CEQ01631.1 putative DNA primase [[Clostridium] sordellii] [Paeniclostridium sordellii]